MFVYFMISEETEETSSPTKNRLSEAQGIKIFKLV
jgi:hypothetical protein